MLPHHISPLGRLTGSVRAERGHAVVAVKGEIDIATVAQLRALLDAALAFGVPQVIVDMSGVEFIDAQALTVLTAAAARLSLGGGKLVVQAPSAQTYRIFHMTQLVGVLGAETPSDGIEIVPGVEAMAMTPHIRDVLDAALKLVVTMAATVVSGADGVSMTLPRHGRFATVAASDDVVLGMDHDQYDTDEGPCLDAAVQGQRFWVESLAEESRWPAFVPLARARGIESILSTPLLSGARSLGALNVYSRERGAVAGDQVRWIDEFAATASTVLCRAEESSDGQALLNDLQRRLASRDVIAVAQGVVMAHDRVSQVAAHASLIASSRRSSVPLLDVCTQVLTAAEASYGGVP